MTTIISHRATTSSRTPGRVNEGTVSFTAARVVPCDDCLGYRLDLVPPGQHGRRWTVRDGRRILVNCANRELEP